MAKLRMAHAGRKQAAWAKRSKVGDKNGQATLGARMAHASRTQAAWAKKQNPAAIYHNIDLSVCKILFCTASSL